MNGFPLSKRFTVVAETRLVELRELRDEPCDYGCYISHYGRSTKLCGTDNADDDTHIGGTGARSRDGMLQRVELKIERYLRLGGSTTP